MRVIALGVVLAVTVARADDNCKPGEFDAHVADGRKEFDAGHYRAALRHYETALVCRNDYNATRHAFVAACKAPDVRLAKLHYKQLTEQDKSYLIQACLPDVDPRP